MSILTILILFVITYYCVKAIGSIWHDAFKGTAPNSNRRKSRDSAEYAEEAQPQKKAHGCPRKPIEKGEGEYIDFTEEH